MQYHTSSRRTRAHEWDEGSLLRGGEVGSVPERTGTRMRPLNVCVNSDVRRMGMQSQVCEWDNYRTSKIQNIPTEDRLERESIIGRWSPSRRRLEHREPVETVAAIAVYRLPRHHRSISHESRWWRCGDRQSARGGSRRTRSERRPINIHTGADRRRHHG